MEIYALEVFFVMVEYQELFWILPTMLSWNIPKVSVDWIRVLPEEPENAN